MRGKWDALVPLQEEYPKAGCGTTFNINDRRRRPRVASDRWFSPCYRDISFSTGEAKKCWLNGLSARITHVRS